MMPRGVAGGGWPDTTSGGGRIPRRRIPMQLIKKAPAATLMHEQGRIYDSDQINIYQSDIYTE